MRCGVTRTCCLRCNHKTTSAIIHRMPEGRNASSYLRHSITTAHCSRGAACTIAAHIGAAMGSVSFQLLPGLHDVKGANWGFGCVLPKLITSDLDQHSCFGIHHVDPTWCSAWWRPIPPLLNELYTLSSRDECDGLHLAECRKAIFHAWLRTRSPTGHPLGGCAFHAQSRAFHAKLSPVQVCCLNGSVQLFIDWLRVVEAIHCAMPLRAPQASRPMLQICKIPRASARAAEL